MQSPIKTSNHGGHSGKYCCHAVSGTTPTDLIEAYIAKGFTHVSITEHRPPQDDRYLYPDEIEAGHDSASLQRRFDEYMQNRAQLQNQFADRISLSIGFESEWYGEQPLEYNIELFKRYKPDTVVLSVHHVKDVCIDSGRSDFERAVEVCGGVDQLFESYYDQQYQLITGFAPLIIESGSQAVVGHLDLVKLFAEGYQPGARIDELLERNVYAAKECGCVIEVNARAFRKKMAEPYPSPKILKMISQIGAEITVGDDAHGPEEVAENFEKLLPFLGEFKSVVAFENDSEGTRQVELLL